MFSTMFEKTQNLLLSMHITDVVHNVSKREEKNLIAHPYLSG